MTTAYVKTQIEDLPFETETIKQTLIRNDQLEQESSLPKQGS
jgi:hypothetical protein